MESIPSPLEHPESENKKEIIVEIGHGPTPITYNDSQSFGKDRIYIGLENNDRSITFADNDSPVAVQADLKDFTSDLRSPEEMEHIHYIKGSGESIPLVDGSVDVVSFANVFGDPRTYHFGVQSHKSFLVEAQRVLKDSGEIIVAETVTPHQEVVEYIEDIAATLGLSVEKLTPSDLEFVHLRSKYLSSINTTYRRGESRPDEYILVLRKQTAS